MGTQKNRLIETVLLSTQNICLNRSERIYSQINALKICLSRPKVTINLLQRRRSEEDEKLMRHYLKEGDLISVSLLQKSSHNLGSESLKILRKVVFQSSTDCALHEKQNYLLYIGPMKVYSLPASYDNKSMKNYPACKGFLKKGNTLPSIL